MKTGDFIAWRYTHENNLSETITRFGTLENIGTFHYIIKDAATGEMDRLLQYQIAIVVDEKYNVKDNKQNISSSMSVADMRQLFINTQDET